MSVFWSINHWGIFQWEYCSNCCSGTTSSMQFFLGFCAIYEVFTFIHSSSSIFSSLQVVPTVYTPLAPEKAHWFLLVSTSFSWSNRTVPTVLVSLQAQISVLRSWYIVEPFLHIRPDFSSGIFLSALSPYELVASIFFYLRLPSCLVKVGILCCLYLS